MKRKKGSSSSVQLVQQGGLSDEQVCHRTSRYGHIIKMNSTSTSQPFLCNGNEHYQHLCNCK